MPLPRPSSPRAALRDLLAFFRGSDGRNYGLIALSIAIPLAIVGAVLFDFRRPAEAPYEIVYGDIIPENPDDPVYKKWQQRRLVEFNERRDAQKAAEAAKRESFKRLADEWGIKTE